jgi:N-acetylmuramoyl-L-alanine amidase
MATTPHAECRPRWGARLARVLLIAAVVGMAVGCETNHRLHSGGEIVAAPLGTVSAYQLAGRVGLKVSESSSVTATLRDRYNTVVLYADPNGQAYVNGRALPGAGGITGVGNMLFLPQRLVEPIRSSLRHPEPAYTPRPPQRQPAPERHAPRRLGTVVLDAGHGGRDPGAIAVTGMYEKTVNLSVVRRAAGMLRQRGVEVLMTRSDDRFIPLEKRADIANDAGADLFVSVHADSAGNELAQGYTLYLARAASDDAERAADCLLTQYAAMPTSSRGIRRADYRVLVRTSCPAVLVELGYLSNVDEARRLGEPAYRQQLAEALCAGVVAYLSRR